MFGCVQGWKANRQLHGGDRSASELVAGSSDGVTVVCTAGGDEILFDPISKWADKYKVSADLFVSSRERARDH